MRSRRFPLALCALLLLVAAPLVADDAPEPSDTQLEPALKARKDVFVPLGGAPFNLVKFADALEAKLKDHCVGYQFVVSFNGTAMVKRAGGMARRAPDVNPRKMTNADKFNVASVSKTMTAIAVMKLLHQKKLSDHHTIQEFLPPSFELGENVGLITFRRLLTHHSGIRCQTKGKFEDLKQCIKAGVDEDDMDVRSYNNINFRLCRLLIPELEEFTPPGAIGPAPGQITAPHDYPKEYMASVQKHVFDPAGLPLLFVKPTDRFPGLGYQFPCPETNGVDFGDMTEFAGSGGWTMSSEQLAAVFGAFLYTDKILPRKIVERMKDNNIGLVARDVTGEVVSYSHGGWYPGFTEKGKPQYGGEVGTLAYGLSNGVSVALIVNSQLGRNWNTRDVVDDAVQQMVK